MRVLLITLLVATAIGQSSPKITVINRVPPQYPMIAKQARIDGGVVLRLSIDSSGRVVHEEVVTGPPMLVQAALQAAKATRFLCEGCREGEVHQRLYTSYFRIGYPDDVALEPAKEFEVTVIASAPAICASWVKMRNRWNPRRWLLRQPVSESGCTCE